LGKGKLFLFFEARKNEMCLTVRLAFSELAGNGLVYDLLRLCLAES
jgi:hypothetical protein